MHEMLVRQVATAIRAGGGRCDSGCRGLCTGRVEAAQPRKMQLNRLPADPGVGSGPFDGKPGLASSFAEKRATVRAIEK